MQAENEKEKNVVNLMDRAKDAVESTSKSKGQATDADYNWNEIMRRNQENSTRMKSERFKSNKGVIRSYRLKH